MKIPKNYAHLAVEYTARRGESLREGPTHTVNIEKAQDLPEAERVSLESFYERASQKSGLNDIPGVQYEELRATRDELHQELESVDLNNDGIDDAERAQMSKAGQIAMKLAESMMAKEPVAAIAAQTFEGMEPEQIAETIREAALQHVNLGYGIARAVLFSYLDNQDGQVRDVYEGKQLKTTGVPPSNLMNTEHTWPKSRGVKDTPAVADLHHLFPADKNANTRRASYPFGMVEEVIWEEGESKLGIDKQGHIVFQPPPGHRGNIARALFYVATVYDLELIEGEPEVLLRWNQEDPVDAQELKRNEEISRFQGNRNPFVDHPELAEQLVSTMKTRAVPESMCARR